MRGGNKKALLVKCRKQTDLYTINMYRHKHTGQQQTYITNIIEENNI